MGKLFRIKRQDMLKTSIADAIEETKQELDSAYANFEHAVEPDLIDSYIYELQSTQLRYKFLLNCAKEAKITSRNRSSYFPTAQ